MDPLVAACVVLTVLLVVAIAVAAVIGVSHLRLRSRIDSNTVGYDPEVAEVPEFAPEPTKGNSGDPAMAPCAYNGISQAKGKPEALKLDLTPGTRKQLGASLRELLSAEVGEGLQAGLGARLDALEHQIRDALERSAPRPMPPSGAPPVMPPAAPCALTPPVKAYSAGAQTAAPSTADRSIGVQEEFGAAGNGAKPRELAFGPTGRSRSGGLPEIPKRIPSSSPEAKALKSNLAELRQNLLAKDGETTRLQKELKQCRQAIWNATTEQKAADLKLRQTLMDPQKVSKAHAEEIRRLVAEVDKLSSSLSETKSQEMYWLTIAQRQRAFFQQNEQIMMPEGSHESMVQGLFKKHPAGEVFLPPPQGDPAGAMDGQMNAASQHPKRNFRSGPRTSHDYHEDDAGTDDEMLDYEDGFVGASGHAFSGLATLPSLPLSHAGEQDYQDEGEGAMLSSDTARSL